MSPLAAFQKPGPNSSAQSSASARAANNHKDTSRKPHAEHLNGHSRNGRMLPSRWPSEAAIVGRAELGRRMAGVGTAWRDSAAVLDVYHALWSARDQPSGIASRYSPIPQYQVAFCNHKVFGELEELVGLLRDRLQGRPVELVFPMFDGLLIYPELLYFFGEFRSISGIAAKESSVWLKSDEDAWIARVLASGTACVFFNSRSLYSRLFQAWQHSAKDPAAIVTQPIVGRRNYGVLSCKA